MTGSEAIMRRVAIVATILSAAGCGSSNSGGNIGATEAGSSGTSSTVATADTGGANTTKSSSDTTGGTAAAEATTAATTGGPVACGEGTACRPLPGPDWVGPLMVRNVGGDKPPDCEGPFASAWSDVYAELDAPPATCACDCEGVGVPTCTPTPLQHWASDNCTGAVIDSWNLTNFCSSSVNINFGSSLRAQPYYVQGASCEPVPTIDISPAVFLQRFLLCTSEEQFPVCDTGSCVPDLPVDDAQLCVAREGDFPCPEQWDDSRVVRYRTFADDRRCTECACADYFEECPSGSIVLFQSNACSDLPYDSVQFNGNCREVSNDGSSARISGAGVVPPTDCTGHATGGASIGSAGPLQPVTVCCAS